MVSNCKICSKMDDYRRTESDICPQEERGTRIAVRNYQIKVSPRVIAFFDWIRRLLQRTCEKIDNMRNHVLQKSNKILLFTCMMAMSTDPLFFYIPVIDGKGKCLYLDEPLLITSSVFRTFCDLLYILCIMFQHQTRRVAPSSHVSGRGELINDAKRYLSFYFIINILSIIPLPQVLLLAIIPKMKRSVSFVALELLKYIVLIQYVPRFLRIYPQYKGVTRNHGIWTETASFGAIYNFCLYMLASHVVGALWYQFSLESELRCWRRELENVNLSAPTFLSCRHHNSAVISLLNSSCPFADPDDIDDHKDFNFGIFIDALRSRVVESKTNFPQKFFYCFWWGLRNISSLGQNLKTSTSVEEIIFTIFIAIFGLVLFLLLIGNMQKYMQSMQTTTNRTEEMRIKAGEMRIKREYAELWMSHHMLPEHLRERFRRYEHYKWQEHRSVEEEALIDKMPKDLRRDIKRHLAFHLLKTVPLFAQMDKHWLNALCDRLKPVHYIEKSKILLEGDLVDEMHFILRGNVASMSVTNGVSYTIAILKAGDFFGEELLTWASSHNSRSLPISTKTVESISKVEALALMADDLKIVISHNLGYKHTGHTLTRYHSLQLRTRAACSVQAAWRRYCKKKIERSLVEADKL